MKRLLIIPVLVGTIALTACATSELSSELASEPAQAQSEVTRQDLIDLENRMHEGFWCVSNNQQRMENETAASLDAC